MLRFSKHFGSTCSPSASVILTPWRLHFLPDLLLFLFLLLLIQGMGPRP